MRFSRLRPWQKGLFAGMLFTLFVDIIQTAVLIVFDLVLASKGLPHYCIMLTRQWECSLMDALFSRLGFFVTFFLVFGVPIMIIGAFIGYLIRRVSIKP